MRLAEFRYKPTRVKTLAIHFGTCLKHLSNGSMVGGGGLLRARGWFEQGGLKSDSRRDDRAATLTPLYRDVIITRSRDRSVSVLAGSRG